MRFPVLHKHGPQTAFAFCRITDQRSYMHICGAVLMVAELSDCLGSHSDIFGNFCSDYAEV